MAQLTTADKIAAYVGGGLVVFGLLEMVLGSGHPVDSEGAIVHEALVPLEIGSYIILLGLIVWGGYAIYKLVATTPPTEVSA